MKNKYSKKQLEELYNCEIFKDTGFDSCTKFWVAQGLPFTEDGEDILFTYADGWDLNELHENIREEIRKSVIVFEGEELQEKRKRIKHSLSGCGNGKNDGRKKET